MVRIDSEGWGNFPSGTYEKMQIRDFDGIGAQEFIV
jgi:hypothetical protein